jgi:hypothetical protein
MQSFIATPVPCSNTPGTSMQNCARMITVCDEELSRTECAPIQPASPSLFPQPARGRRRYCSYFHSVCATVCRKTCFCTCADRNRSEEVERGGGRVRGARLEATFKSVSRLWTSCEKRLHKIREVQVSIASEKIVCKNGSGRVLTRVWEAGGPFE